MRVGRVRATNFGPLGVADVDLGARLSVLTGANGVGKSTVLQALALVRDAVVLPRNLGPWAESLRFNESRFEVRVSIEFDQPHEQVLLDQFAVAAVSRLVHLDNAERGDGLGRVEAVTRAMGEQPAAALYTGDLVVSFGDRRAASFWSAWEFEIGGWTAHIGLSGPTTSQLQPLPFDDIGRTVHPVRPELALSTNNLTQLIIDGQVIVSVADLVASGEAYVFEVAAPSNGVEASVIQDVLAAAGAAAESASQRLGRERQLGQQRVDRAQWADVLGALMSTSLVVTDNHRRSARTTFRADELTTPFDLSDGSAVAAELFRLKNGDVIGRSTYKAAQEIFHRLTDRHFELTASFRVVPLADPDVPAGVVSVDLEPRVSPDPGADGWALRRSGAGTAEALYLSLVLADTSRVVCLDEPGVHLSPTVQRRLNDLLTRAPEQDAQVIVVTHNPDLVLAGTPQQASAIVHLVAAAERTGSRGAVGEALRGVRPGAGNTGSVGRVEAVRLSPTELDDLGAVRRLRVNEFRAMLFAQGVVLTEGEHDALFVTMWADKLASTTPALSLERNNLMVHSVGGDTEFAGAAGLLTELRVPYVIIADGPALDPVGTFTKQFRKRGWDTPSGETLQDSRDEWAVRGVFTLAAEYGTKTKRGEIEAYMQRVDSTVFSEISARRRRPKSTEIVRDFCEQVDPADDFRAMWQQVVKRLTGA